MFFVWPNNQIDVRQVNRRKTNLISYVWESRDMKLSYSQQLRLICHSELREGAGESGASKGREIHPRDIGRTNIWYTNSCYAMQICPSAVSLILALFLV